MSPDDMIALAEHDERLTEIARLRSGQTHGLVRVSLDHVANLYRESARYWREKARKNEGYPRPGAQP